MRRVPWLLLPLCLILGFVLGRRSAPLPPAAVAESPPPRRALRVGPLTCVDVGTAQAADDHAARLARCESQLAELQGPKPTFAEPWPQDVGAEAPEAWTTAMQQVFATCGLGLDLEAVDCEEYPCTAVLRGDVPEEEAANLTDRLYACPAWQQWGASLKKPDATFQQMDIRCPDGSYQSAWVFLGTDNESDAMEAVAGTDVGLVPAIMLLGRRADAAAKHWRCD